MNMIGPPLEYKQLSAEDPAEASQLARWETIMRFWACLGAPMRRP